MDDSRLLQESNLAARQPEGATFVIQAITGEGLAQGPYVAARAGVEPTALRTEDTDNLNLTNHAFCLSLCITVSLSFCLPVFVSVSVCLSLFFLFSTCSSFPVGSLRHPN